MDDYANYEQKITILAWRQAEARKALDALVKKAARYGNEDITYFMSPAYSTDRRNVGYDGRTRRAKVDVIDVLVFGTAPKYGDYHFVAKVEPIATGNIVMTLPKQVAHDRFRTTGNVCEHCNKNRKREFLYVVENSNGEQSQVGKTCLRDYMGIDDPSAIANRFATYAAFNAWSEGGFGIDYHTLNEVMEITIINNNLWGWVSVGNSDDKNIATRDHVISVFRHYNLCGEKRVDRIMDFMKDDAAAAEVSAKAQRVVQWVREEMVVRTDYQANLVAALASDVVRLDRNMGLICSAVSAYDREMGYKTARALKAQSERETSKFVGMRKERLKNVSVTVISQNVIGRNEFGERVLIKMVDAEGNIMVWFTDSAKFETANAIVNATVVKHEEYNGVKQTTVNRVAQVEVK